MTLAGCYVAGPASPPALSRVWLVEEENHVTGAAHVLKQRFQPLLYFTRELGVSE